MAQLTLNPSKDVPLQSDQATTNQDGTALFVGEVKAATQTFRLLIQFDLSSIPTNATVSAATLRLYDEGTDLADNTRTMSAYRCKRTWGETTATWNTYDGSNNWGTAGADNTTSDRETTESGSISMPATEVAGYVDITLTVADIQAMVSGSYTNNGFVLRMATETDDCHKFSDRSGNTTANKPQLVVTYTAPSGAISGYFDV